jgi:uncharacterized protein DUF6174
MRLRTTLRTALVAIAAAAALPAFADAALDGARARWQAAALTSYEYGYQKYCDCHRDNPPETVITVRGGSVAGVRHRPAGTTTEVPGRNPEYYWTVDGLFELIAAAQARGVQVRAAYDADLGFPREIYIDYDSNLIGDELDVRLTGVTRLDAAR